MCRVFVDFLTEYFKTWINFGLGIEVTEGGDIFNWKMGGIWTDQLEIEKLLFLLFFLAPPIPSENFSG